ncbi:hypothetical protein L6164_030911 [Bauhinia variegata]|uniref:Uncharacterized protein n=1 Tax=Bauhinia variegata TaxID=167791 RepID=A0ACB9LE50_BAUVA|nr:hypothetical protein L6164_030911 [Bauhinia variegata]
MWDENLPQERRRSARIIALEERKENETKALPASAGNKSENLQRDKEKKVIDVDDDDLLFMDDSDDYEDELNVSTRKRGRKHKALDQLISSTQQHDVHLMCNNAMNFNAKSSVYHRVASTIQDKARSIFVLLRANPENIDLDALRHKRSRGVARPQGRPCRAAQLPGEHDEESDCVQHEIEERRCAYSPPKDDSPASEARRGPKQNFELNEPTPSNEESLNHFSQRLSGETASPSQNHPTPQEGNYGADADADHNKNIGTTIEHGAGVRNKGKAICLDEGDYHATAAALLGSIFQNFEQGESSRAHHVEASNIRRPLEIDLNTDPSMDPMVPTLENEAPIQGHGQGSIHHQNLDLLQPSACNNNASNGECSNAAGTSDILPSTNLGRGGRVQSLVWPTRVISGPQPIHSNSWSCYGLNQSLSSHPFFPYYYPLDYFYGNYNYSASAIDSRWQAIFPPQAADQTYQPGNSQQLLGSSYNYSQHFAWNTYGYAGMYHNTPAYGYGGTDPMNLMGYGGRDSLHERTQGGGEAAQFLLDEEDNLDLSLHL